jgi:hypothetical protein
MKEIDGSVAGVVQMSARYLGSSTAQRAASVAVASTQPIPQVSTLDVVIPSAPQRSSVIRSAAQLTVSGAHVLHRCSVALQPGVPQLVEAMPSPLALQRTIVVGSEQFTNSSGVHDDVQISPAAAHSPSALQLSPLGQSASRLQLTVHNGASESKQASGKEATASAAHARKVACLITVTPQKSKP